MLKFDPMETAMETLVQWEKAGDHVGRNITVIGRVMATKNIGRICFLIFTEKFEGKFAVSVFEESFSNGRSHREVLQGYKSYM